MKVVCCCWGKMEVDLGINVYMKFIFLHICLFSMDTLTLVTWLQSSITENRKRFNIMNRNVHLNDLVLGTVYMRHTLSLSLVGFDRFYKII